MDMLDRKQLTPSVHPDLIRLGVPRDGGYVVPEAQVRESTVLLSLGIREDWSFDRAFIAMNPAVRVIGVDHSVGPAWFAKRIGRTLAGALAAGLRGNRRTLRKQVAALRGAVDYFVFFAAPHRHVRKRAAAADSGVGIGLPTLLAMAAVDRDHGAFLKIDVEGSEYDLIRDIVGCERRIGAMVVEFHGLSRRAARFNQAIAQLLQHFRVVHVHGNNYAAYNPEHDFPDAVEVTFVHRALTTNPPVASRHTYPRPGLDYPNAPGRPDYSLRFE